MVKRMFATFILGMAAATSASAVTSVLMAENQLEKGQVLTSRSGLYALIVQDDGNVVEYFTTLMGNRLSQFSTNTRKSGDHLRMQMDGNLALYKSNGTWAWNSGTGGRPYDLGYKLVLFDTGRLVIMDSNNAVVKVLNESDRPSRDGGPFAKFPFRKVSFGTCTESLTGDFQSGSLAEDWAWANGGSIGYCNSPY
ncbi:hypothetical protein [Rugamonas sp. DEMB1]|uniref:hypothetical protein n=1 Tax=Rugamonas sp. DEMB1 TaxID=3039386 RepID=UPI002446F1BA|nr:hypothetical protein [Rugamonas sp. DEMB1]WGG52095.1 hypothetical protein QC826_07925 [Rugamonas sp. DEMB1]